MASESASASSTPAPEPAGAGTEPTPVEAARAVAELRTRQAQVLAERRRRDPRWVGVATTALSVAGIAVRETDESWRHRRHARIAIGAASAAAGLPWGGVARADLWLGSPVPAASLSPTASSSPAASGAPSPSRPSGDGVDWEAPDYAPMRGVMRATGRSVSSTLAAAALGRFAIGRLRARGVRRLWIADCVLIVVTRLLGTYNAKRTEAALQQAARDVGAAAIDGVEAPSLAPQLADPTVFSLAALLLPASAVREDLLGAALPLDRVVLADRLAALARAGLIEQDRRGRLRPRAWWSLTDRGRELATSHAAALRQRAR